MVEDAVPGAGGEGRSRPAAAEPGFWRQVVEQLSTALMVVDPAGRILAVNPAAERLLGRAAAAMRGNDAHELLHRDTDGGTSRESSARCSRRWPRGPPRAGRATDICAVTAAWSRSPGPPLP